MVLSDECYYENKTTSKNGVIIEEIETKVCKETIQLNTKFSSDEFLICFRKFIERRST